ncbi:MAG: chemotaxis protein CheW [Pseudomonadota bacterium]|nr:chemotaxis protein CheW [Pseudomonadota bacterium]
MSEASATLPFALLQRIARRLGAGQAMGALPTERRWRGLLFEAAGVPCVVAAERITEVAYQPVAVRLPGAPAWLPGLVQLRGALIPLIDLQALAGGAPGEEPARQPLLRLRQGRDQLCLRVDSVSGFGAFDTPGPHASVPPAGLAGILAGVVGEADEQRWVVDGDRLFRLRPQPVQAD